MNIINKITLLAVATFLSTNVAAHELQAGGLINGLAHPVFGPDHLLAMIAVGVLSVQIGNKAIWTLPATFLVFMLGGGVLGISGIPLPMVETGIAVSVLVLGIAIALDRKMPIILTIAMVGVFGIFHGYAHGQEMPKIAEPMLYAEGFLISTAGLHIVGMLIGSVSKLIPRGDIVLRVLGVGVGVVGLYILFGL